VTRLPLLAALVPPAAATGREAVDDVAGSAEVIRVVLADGRSGRARATEPMRRVLTHFAIGTVVTLLMIMGSGYVVGGHLAEQEALRDVERVAEVAGHAIIEPNLSEGLLTGDPAALAKLDEAVREHLLPGTSMRRIKLWTPSGRIVYSDDPRLINDTHSLGKAELRVLREGTSATDVSDLGRQENRLERSLGPRLLEVYTVVRTAAGEPLLFEAYLSYDMIAENRASILSSFARFTLLGLVVFAVFQLSLAYANLRWLHRQRVRLMERTVRIADYERRRVARDLHDGVVQDLVGASYVVGGAIGPVEARGEPDVAAALRGAVGGIRTSIQGLRSMIIEIYPASLRSAGLRAALSDLVAPMQGRGTDVRLHLPEDIDLPPHVEAGIYRAAQELLRNAVNHGRASTIQLLVTLGHGRAVLTVRDDGQGFDPHQPPASGHVGLQGVADLVEESGGVLEVASCPGQGTEVRMELPT
jgi:two-component system, NarL family, sensor kinase